MSFRSDGTFPAYADKETSTNWTGQSLPLWGATGVTVQAVSTNGSVGTVYVEGTNQPGATATWAQMTTLALSSNGSAYAVFSPNDQLTAMHAMRCRYVSSSGTGNVTISVNIRRNSER